MAMASIWFRTHLVNLPCSAVSVTGSSRLPNPHLKPGMIGTRLPYAKVVSKSVILKTAIETSSTDITLPSLFLRTVWAILALLTITSSEQRCARVRL